MRYEKAYATWNWFVYLASFLMYETYLKYSSDVWEM